MGLDYAATKYGRLPRAALIAPAIALARDGFVLSRADTDILDGKADRFGQGPRRRQRFFCGPTAAVSRPGDRLVQSDLAATLELISQQGPERVLQRPGRGRCREGEQREWRDPGRR